MSDHRAESGFSPIALTAAMAGRGGFQPRSFVVPAPPPVVDAAIAAPQPAEDPFAHGLAEGQRLAETAFAAERHRLLALLAATEALQDEPSEELAQLTAETVERLVRQIVAAAPLDAAWLMEQAETADRKSTRLNART